MTYQLSKNDIGKLDLETVSLDKKDELILTSRDFRVKLSQTSFTEFLTIYYRHKLQLPSAGFHRYIIETLDQCKDFIAIIGFRGSAKSTILEAFALWSMLCQKSKFTVYIGSTDDKAKMAVMNIKQEIEDNEVLRNDFGIHFEAEKKRINDKWSESQLTVNGYTILAKSRGAKIRGLLFNGSRITMIICDDLEDTENAKTAENRKRTRQWFFTEAMLATAQGTLATDVKIVMLGNLVHKDCLIANLDKKKLDNGNIIHVVRIPLIDENGEITWKGLYPDMQAVEKQKQKVYLSGEGLGRVIWAREYLLVNVDEEDQIIKDTDIQYYDMSWLQRNWEQVGVGVDLAISEKQTADYTSMVKAVFVRNDYGERRLLILPNPIKERLSFENTISKAKLLKVELNPTPTFFVENVAYQKSAIEIMQKNGINAVPVPATKDKRSRLIEISPYIKSGMVLFPKTGCEVILEEVVGFGIEAHDDVLDAFVHVVNNMLNNQEVICV